MLSRLASWMVLADGDMPNDAGVEKPTHRKAVVLGCGAVIIIGAGSYTVYKYRDGIKAFLNRLYASTSQYMRVCLQMDTSNLAAPAPQEEVNKETGASDNAATDETQRDSPGDVAIPLQADELIVVDELVANGMGDLMHVGYIVETGDLGFPFGPYQQVDGGGAGQTLYDTGPSIVDVTPEEQGEGDKTAPTQDKSDETPQLANGGAAEKNNALASNDSKDEDESQQQMGDKDTDD